MNQLIENGILSEMKCGNQFAYILNDNANFLSTEYKVLQSQEEGCFVKCMKLLFNGKIQFYYLTNGYKSLANMIPSLDADRFMTIMASVFSNILTVKQNGFLSCQNIVITLDKIFVDINTYKASLVYLPISERLYQDESIFENELRTSLVKVIASVSTLSDPKTAQFSEDLSNGMLSVKDIYDRLKGSQGANSSASRKRGVLRIVAMNAPTPVELEVTKDLFVIGKNPAIVDGVISFNRMISRRHCQIIKKEDQYRIVDLQSANGTYVNRIRLVPNQPCQIENGDIIRLANSDFQAVIS